MANLRNYIKSELFTAERAREFEDEYNDNQIIRWLKNIDSSIKDAIENSFDYVTIEKAQLSIYQERVISILKTAGYNITDDSSNYIISWKKI